MRKVDREQMIDKPQRQEDSKNAKKRKSLKMAPLTAACIKNKKDKPQRQVNIKNDTKRNIIKKGPSTAAC